MIRSPRRLCASSATSCSRSRSRSRSNTPSESRSHSTRQSSFMTAPYVLLCSAEALLERVELPADLVGQLVAELGQVLAHLRELGLDRVLVDREQPLQGLGREVEPVDVQRALGRDASDRRVGRLGLAVAAAEDPLQDTGVLAEAGPQELALVVLAEPVDVEDLRQLVGVALGADVQPVLEVVGHVVAAEGQHGEGVEAQLAE